VPVATSEKEQKKPGGNGISSLDLYHSMEMGEQERLESLGGNEDEDDSEKDSSGSLLSMAGGSDDDNDIDQEHLTGLLTCMSCSGVLPAWQDEQNAHVDEQSYCLSDRGQPLSQDNSNVEEELNVCFGAVRCWKAKVREEHGLVRISRGCMSGGHGVGNRHSTQSNSEHQSLHPCMGAISNDSSTKNNDTSKQPRSMVWTSSHTYSSASAGQQQPPSYAIECCTGRDRCNDGSFPSLSGSGLSAINENGSLLAAVAWWRWSSISVAALLLVIVIVATVSLTVFALYRNDSKNKKRKRRKRSKSSSSRRSKRRKRSTRHYEDGNSDDSDKKDKKRHRHLSFSSISSSSSSLSSVASSSSCCEGKKRGRRKPNVTALTMVDLLKGVVVTNEGTADDEITYGSSSNRPSYPAEYSPAAMTESTVDDDFLPPPYQRRNDPQKDHQEDDWTSGSGYGMPVLVQRTLAKQIQLRQLVGKGRYGEVWRATYWNGGHEHVAVKIFLSKDEPSWKRETEIYSTVLMRHDNILGFIGSDIMTSRNSYTTQLLLITHYHRHGSLYDFLQTPTAVAEANGYDIGTIDAAGGRLQQTDRDRPPLTVCQMLNVLYTVASGLCHLHTEIHGTQGKPGIAHRDIKSKNVLVKCAQTGACCVADFGMAVTSRDATLPIQTTTAAGANQNTRVGTKRYMAPEVLDDSISSAATLALASASTSATAVSSVASSSSSTAASVAAAASSSSAYWCFDAYRRGDVYSYALVMWEVLSRTLIEPNVNNDEHLTQQPNDNQQKPSLDNKYDPYVYRAPYQDRGVGWDPGFDDMRRVVCSADPVLSRPGVAAEWLANPIMNAVVVTMRECWHSNPHARLPSLRVKKTLAKLIEQYSTTETEKQHKSEPEQ
ncbi:Receptor protein serine/threonine kinase, partial [Aphis craccivora]